MDLLRRHFPNSPTPVNLQIPNSPTPVNRLTLSSDSTSRRIIGRIRGAVTVSGKNLFKLLARKSHILLYPGGIREGLHRKGETGKLFWPDKQEFVRMAVKFGATIIPYGGVGEDDLLDRGDGRRYCRSTFPYAYCFTQVTMISTRNRKKCNCNGMDESDTCNCFESKRSVFVTVGTTSRLINEKCRAE